MQTLTRDQENAETEKIHNCVGISMVTSSAQADGAIDL